MIDEELEVIGRVTKIQWGHVPSAFLVLGAATWYQPPVLAPIVFLSGLLVTTILATADAVFHSRPTVRNIARLSLSLGFCNAALLGIVACTPRSYPGKVELGAAILVMTIMTLVIAVLVALLALPLHLLLNRVRAFHAFGYCSICGYDLRGTPGDRCSECGKLISPRERTPTYTE